MRRLALIFLLFISTCTSGFGQAETDALNLLGGIIRSAQPEGQVVYTDKLNSVELLKIKSKLKKNVITSITEDTKQNTVTLTKNEITLIFEQLDAYMNSYWNENLFPNSILIKEEDLLTYFKNTYEAYSENLTNPNNTPDDKNNLIKNYQQPSVFKFTSPIYLRDKSICMVYYKYVCGNPCGNDELCFYKKENNNWVKWVVVSTDSF